MERPEILRPCDRKECESSHRQQYCEIEGSDSESGIANIARTFDRIMHSKRSRQDYGPTHLTDQGRDIFLRRFILPGEAAIKLQHVQNRVLNYQKYDIQFEWTGGQMATLYDPYCVEYTINIWPGSAEAIMCEHNLSMASLENPDIYDSPYRFMTPYDHEKLFNLLSEVDDLQQGIDRKKQVSDNDPGN